MVTPASQKHHSITSATAVNILGANLRPKGSTKLTKTCPSHLHANSGLLWRCTGTSRSADLMLIYAINTLTLMPLWSLCWCILERARLGSITYWHSCLVVMVGQWSTTTSVCDNRQPPLDVYKPVVDSCWTVSVGTISQIPNEKLSQSPWECNDQAVWLGMPVN